MFFGGGVEVSRGGECFVIVISGGGSCSADCSRNFVRRVSAVRSVVAFGRGCSTAATFDYDELLLLSW